MRYTFLLLTLFLFLGCAPKVVDIKHFNPSISFEKIDTIAVYESDNDRILFYDFTLQNDILREKSWGKVLPFRVDFMDLWVTGLGHDIKRLTNNHAETIKDALLWAAQKEGMKPLHVTQHDYIIDVTFAKEMVDAIESYEEKMRRYDKDRRFPLLPLPLL
jgi:hypothetical protein